MDNRFLDKFDIRLRRHLIENENISSKEIADNLNTLEEFNALILSSSFGFHFSIISSLVIYKNIFHY